MSEDDAQGNDVGATQWRDPLETAEGQMVDALNVLTRRHTALSLRYTELFDALDALVDRMRYAAVGTEARAFADELAAEVAKHREPR
jgi:hypothetical protein